MSSTDTKKKRRRRTPTDFKITTNIPPGGSVRLPPGALFKYFGDELKNRFLKTTPRPKKDD